MRMLLIEDSVRLQESLTAGFERAGFAVDAVGDGDRGLIFARREHYDLILLDLGLPGLDGLGILEALRDGRSDVHIMIITARTSVEERVRGLNAGADDYVIKPFAFEELLARAQALVRRSYRSKAPDISLGELVVETTARRVTYGGNPIELAQREYRIVEYIARRAGETVSRIEIEDHVYGEDNLPGSNAVESAICLIRKKFNESVGRKVDLIRTRRGLGYSMELPVVLESPSPGTE